MGIRHIASGGKAALEHAPARTTEYFPAVKHGHLDYDGDEPSEVGPARFNQRTLGLPEHTDTYKAPTDVTMRITISVPTSLLPAMTDDNFDLVLSKAEKIALAQLDELHGADITDRFALRYDMQEYEDEVEVTAYLTPLKKIIN